MGVTTIYPGEGSGSLATDFGRGDILQKGKRAGSDTGKT